ncbi:MAG: sulfate adenylyltransferase [Alphaproteobacteria bacterium]|nr:sulfate adenylyltransferase [Alphaproteobacteria bacterium]
MNALDLQAETTSDAGVLRFITAGSVDDGKSTLIGRLLFDAKGLLRDQVAALSKSRGAKSAQDSELDLALVTDGLESEREQGITIDVAYRYFATPRRTFVIADAPGHEQYTRNMVTAASNAEVAVILIDASRIAGKGLKAQTRRHATIAKLMGLKIIVAINKMDLTGWSRAVYDEIRDGFARVARTLGIEDPIYVPIAAVHGDNVTRPSPHTPWYEGPPLLEILEAIDATRRNDGVVRFPVQRVLRMADGVRAYAGRLESGVVRAGDEVLAMPSGQQAVVQSIRTFDGALKSAIAGQSISIVLDRDLDLGRGDTLTSLEARAAKGLVADLCWLDEQPWEKGRRYLLKQGTRTTQALIDGIVFVREMTELSEVGEAAGLKLNDVASVRIKMRDPVLADLYGERPATGAFVLIDPVSNQTAAAGMIREAA